MHWQGESQGDWRETDIWPDPRPMDPGALIESSLPPVASPPLPVHQLIDICRWAGRGSIEHQQREIERLEAEASGFELGEAPEEELSEELINLSRKHQELVSVKTSQELELKRMESDLEASLLRASSCLSVVEAEEARWQTQLESHRKALRERPYTAAEKQQQIERCLNAAERCQEIQAMLDQCRWYALEKEASWADLPEATRRDMVSLAGTHRKLDKRAQQAVNGGAA